MQINSVNSSLQIQKYATNGSIGGIRLPDFLDEYTYTRTVSGMSNAEFKKLIEEQAYTDYSNGKFQNQSADFIRLMKQYVSEVSPDRKGIITTGLKKMASDNQRVLEPIDVVATLLEGKVSYQKRPDGKSEYIEFRDQNGELIATHSKYGWKMYTTKAESARHTEFRLIYMEAWGKAKRGETLQTTGEFKFQEDLQNTFDAQA